MTKKTTSVSDNTTTNHASKAASTRTRAAYGKKYGNKENVQSVNCSSTDVVVNIDEEPPCMLTPLNKTLGNLLKTTS